MRKRFGFILVTGALAALVSAASLSASGGGPPASPSAPSATAAEPTPDNQTRSLLADAIRLERQALKTKKRGRFVALLNESRRALFSAANKLDDFTWQHTGLCSNRIESAYLFDGDALKAAKKGPGVKAKRFVRQALDRKLHCFGLLPGPSVDLGCDEETVNDPTFNDDDDFAVGNCESAVREVTLQTAAPFTAHSRSAVFGKTDSFRTGDCMPVNSRTLECPISPPMNAGENFVIVALKGLPPGTKVTIDIEAPDGRVERATVTTK